MCVAVVGSYSSRCGQFPRMRIGIVSAARDVCGVAEGMLFIQCQYACAAKVTVFNLYISLCVGLSVTMFSATTCNWATNSDTSRFVAAKTSFYKR